MPSSPNTGGMIAGVTQVDDFSDEETSSVDSENSGHRSENGALLRTGSNSDAGSRTNSMRAKPIKKLPATAEQNDLSTEEKEEALEEISKAAKSGSANLHSLHLGKDIAFVKKLLSSTALPGLRELILSENGIESLPHNIFDKVPNLEKLDLTNNRLTVIPLSAMTLRKLEVLLLDHNHISSVPATYDIAEPLELPSLQILGLEWNRLTDFPAHLHEVAPNLRKIFMCENLGIQNLPPLESFPTTFTTDVRLDNRPTLMEQYKRGGYERRVSVDWNKIYPDKVLDFVYLGSLRTAQCVEVYRDLDIKYVLTAGRNLEVYLADGMQQLELPLDDVPGENISLFFADAFSFIDNAVATKKGVLLHCFAGLSRSVTVMVAYLMKTQYPMSMRDALALVKTARPNSHPNDGFIRSLEKYEEQLKDEKSGR